jgi:hypothetical protein
MAGQRHRRGRYFLEIEPVALQRISGPAMRRFPLRGQIGADGVTRARVVRKDVFQRGVEPVRYGSGAPFGLGTVFRRMVLAAVAGGFAFRQLGWFIAPALDQRIALDLLVDEDFQLGMAQLQQLDRLHQLRRHHQ